MAANPVKLEYSARFTPEEAQRLALGLVPEQMEDKWFVYLEDDVLYLHRSWTGDCSFVVELGREGAGYVTRSVYADPRLASDEGWGPRYAAQLLHFLIQNLLLGHATPFPLPPGQAQDAPRGVFQAHVSGTAFSEVGPEGSESSRGHQPALPKPDDPSV